MSDRPTPGHDQNNEKDYEGFAPVPAGEGSIPEPTSWTLRGAGMYGSDVEVVSLELYKELAARCKNAEAATLMWGRKCIQLEEGREPAEFNRQALAAIAAALRLPVSAIVAAWPEPEAAGPTEGEAPKKEGAVDWRARSQGLEEALRELEGVAARQGLLAMRNFIHERLTMQSGPQEQDWLRFGTVTVTDSGGCLVAVSPAGSSDFQMVGRALGLPDEEGEDPMDGFDPMGGPNPPDDGAAPPPRGPVVQGPDVDERWKEALCMLRGRTITGHATSAHDGRLNGLVITLDDGQSFQIVARTGEEVWFSFELWQPPEPESASPVAAGRPPIDQDLEAGRDVSGEGER